MKTTTGQAAGVMVHLEFFAQVFRREVDVRCASVTDRRAQIAPAGPRSRGALAQMVEEDAGDAAIAHQAARSVTLLGGSVEGRPFRLPFLGERAHEIAASASFGDEIAKALMQAGAPFGIRPYGVEATNVLRMEEAHAAHNEIDGP